LNVRTALRGKSPADLGAVVAAALKRCATENSVRLY
jgi:hypothetical protein